VQQVLERVVERGSHLLGARGGALFLASADGSMLRAAISRVPWADYNGLTLRLGEGLAGHVAQTGQPAIVNDYQHWPQRIPAAMDSRLTAAACVPLRWAGQVLGVLSILDDQPNRVFTRDDLELLAQLAPQAGLSIRNAQLYTELERNIEELRRTQAQLVRSEKLAALGRLAASIAHEVNNPLQSIQNCLELCQRPALGASKRAEYLALAEEEVERVVTIVQRLLDFYRPAQEGRVATQVNDVLQDVLALANQQLEHARVRVRRVLDPALPRLAAIPGHLKQVFLNLILNALEAMPGGGELCVTTRNLDPGWLAVEFVDTGAGIAAADLPKVFEPFFTLKAKGSGLGLAVSYGIVQAHGGTIEVSSAAGAGSTFTVKLPVSMEGAHG
jgi:two-component system NtrC family sensor kinase